MEISAITMNIVWDDFFQSHPVIGKMANGYVKKEGRPDLFQVFQFKEKYEEYLSFNGRIFQNAELSETAMTVDEKHRVHAISNGLTSFIVFTGNLTYGDITYDCFMDPSNGIIYMFLENDTGAMLKKLIKINANVLENELYEDMFKLGVGSSCGSDVKFNSFIAYLIGK